MAIPQQLLIRILTLRKEACFVSGPFQSPQEQLLSLSVTDGQVYDSHLRYHHTRFPNKHSRTANVYDTPTYNVSSHSERTLGCSHLKPNTITQVQMYPPPDFFKLFVHRFCQAFSDCEKNIFSFLKNWINHLILITLFFLIPSVHDNVLVVSIETRSASNHQFLQPFFIFICYPETNSLGS